MKSSSKRRQSIFRCTAEIVRFVKDVIALIVFLLP